MAVQGRIEEIKIYYNTLQSLTSRQCRVASVLEDEVKFLILDLLPILIQTEHCHKYFTIDSMNDISIDKNQIRVH